MKKHELNRERRRQQALERLGTNKPWCVMCGFDDPVALELHHVAGRAFDGTLIVVCRNCHRLLSDMQKDHPEPQNQPPSELESILHYLLGRSDVLVQLLQRDREIADRLFALVQRSRTDNDEAES
jgi:hypothetical protein